MKERTIVFIGAGNVAEALVRGIMKAGLFQASHVRVTDIDAQRLKHFETAFKVTGYQCNTDGVAKADVVILSVKPQVLPDVLVELKSHLLPSALVVSIAAGVKTSFIEARLNEGTRVIRVMPNTAAWVGKGAAAFCCGRWATEEDARFVENLFRAVGIVVRLDEAALDAVTALSGSGPAYVFYLVESMLAAAEKMGLDKITARILTMATVEGAARLLAETGLDPQALRRRVTSQGGTTAAALELLQKHHVLETLVAAILAAQKRSQELSQ